MTTPVVEITSGKIAGRTDAGVHRFLGVPYGATTAGTSRFRPPASPAAWTGERETVAFGPTAPQAPVALSSANVLGDTFAPVHPAQGEDCLVLNVWTAGLDDGGRPVMVWLHGGAFTSLSGSTVNGARLAARDDVVVVSLNHRLNVPGFLDLDELAPGRYEHSGIVGMLDVVAALEWVRDHIAAFGGDPSRVTVFGCSGGGLKVSTLLSMPSARGLFHRAVIQSGPYLQAVRRETAVDFAERVLHELGLTPATLDGIHDLPVEQLIDAQRRALATSQVGTSGGWPLWTVGPVVGDPLFPSHPFEPTASPLSSDIPLVIGNNKNEGSLGLITQFATDDDITDDDLRRVAVDKYGEHADAILELYRRERSTTVRAELLDALIATDAMWLDSVRIAERKAAVGPAPVFMYEFAYETDAAGGRARACHALEVPFVFDDTEAAPLTGTRPGRVHVARVMSEAWVAFARDGDPNHPGLPKWPAYTSTDRSRMVFDVTTRLEPDPATLRDGLVALGMTWNPAAPT